MKLQIQFGALAPPIEVQLDAQGLILDMDDAQRTWLQRDVDEVSRLRIRGVLTESESDKARARIMKAITKQARRQDGLRIKGS